MSNNGQGGLGLPSSLVALNGVVLSSRPIGGIRRSTDNGATWTLASAGGVINGLNGAGHLVNHNGRIILPFSDGSLTYVNGVPSIREGIVFSDDLGLTWTYSPNAAVSGADAQSDGTTVFFGGTHYSATGGVTTDPLDQTGASGVPRRIIRIGNTLFMITSTGLFRRDIGTLDLRASTQIVVHPINSPTLIDGDSYTFSVLAGGENITYQWKKGTTDIPGATGPKLTLNPVMAADSGSYSVVVTGDLGTLTSSPATLTVQTPEDGKDDPTFPQSPATRSTALLAVLDDYTVVENDANFLQRYGDNGFINSRGFASGRFFYQTLDRAGRLVLADDILGNPGRVIRIDPKTLADDPSFTPFVLDANVGFTSVEELPGRGYLLAPERNGTRNKLPLNSVILIDYQGNLDPRFDTGDADQVSFRRQVSSIAVTEDGSIITWDGSNLIKLNHDGSTDTAFAPTPKGPVWAVSGNRVMTYHQFSFGVRSLVALNTDGTVDPAFNPNRLGFNQNPSDMVEQLDGKLIVVGNFTTYGGESVVEQVRINTDGTRDTTFYDAAGYPSGYPTDVAYDPRGFAYLSPSATGSSYRYQDSNKQGLIRIFTDRADFGIWRQSAGGDVSRNDTHQLSVIAFGTGLTYQWFKDEAPINGATSSVLTIAPFTAAQNGDYTVRISAGARTQTSHPMTLAEVAEPVITAQPLGGDALLGQPYTFSVGFRAATGTVFQWRKNGVAITGATQQFLNLPALAFTDAGRYSVIVSNSFGSVTSANATLTVNEVTGSRDTAVGSVFINNDVYAIEIMPDGSAIIGGEFSQVGGAAHPMFARINADGTRFGGAWTDANMGGTGIRTYDFELQSSGKILIGGDIASIQGTAISKLARLNADGTLDTTFVGTTFNSFLRTIASLESDKFFIGGNFTVGPRQFLALMNEDGTVDTSFQLNPNDTVAKILRLADGKIMVAGRFTTLGGQTANRVARLNADFTLDPTFNAPVFNNQVEDMDIDGIGRPVVVGFFTTVDGQSRNYAARLNTDGSLDSTFDMGTALNQVAYAVDVQLNGKIVIGGQFTGRITRVLENGGVDPFYSKNFTPNATVFEVVTTPDGKLYIGGGFTQPVASFMRATTDKSDPAITANPQSVAIDLGGSASLNVGVFTTTTAAYQWFKNGNPIPGATDASLLLTGVTRADAGSYSVDVTTSLGSASSSPANVTVLAEPQILNEPPPALLAVTGGEIRLTVAASGRGPLSYTWQKDGNPLPTEARITGATTPGLIISNAVLSDAGRYSVSISNNLGSTNSRPTVATVIIPPGGIRDTFSTADTPNGAVEIIVPVDGGDLVIGGSFTTVRGESHQRLARLTSDGSIVSGFTATANNTVYDIAAQPDGKLIVVGAFTQINGLAKNRVARLNSDGSLDTTFDVGTGPNGTVLGTAVQPDGRILVVGQFSQVTGTTRSYAARLNADGSLDPSFDITAFHYGHDVAVLDDGRILIGGRGTMLGRNYLVRLHPDGTLDTNFNHTVNQPVYHVLPQADGKVVISGQFSSVDSVNKTGIARLNADGTLDSGFNAFTTSTLLVNSLAAQYDGKIVLGGSFTSFNGETRNRLVRLTPDGSLDALFDTGTGFNAGSVNALYLTPNGNIWAGGTFSSYNGTASASLVQLNGDPVLLAITRHPTGQQLDLGSPGILTAGATGTSTITYQWHKDGSPILGANNATLTFGSATRTDAGDYFVTAGNDSGSLTSRVARVTVLAEPVITRQPDSITVADGTPVTLSVSALGAGTLGYQWRRNGVAIGNANGPSLNLTGAVADSACYDVIITNVLGGVTSEAAALGIYVAAGTIDPGFAPPGGANNIVFAAAALPNGNVAIAGSFTAVGNDFRTRFAVLDPQGNGVSLANNFSSAQTILTMAAEPDGKIVMGHSTGNVRLNPDGSVDSSFQGAGGYTPVVAVHNGHTYMGGFFGTFDGSLRRVTSATGVDDTIFGSNTLAAGAQNVTALAFQTDGKILVGESPGSIKRLNTDGTLDASFSVTGVNLSSVTCLGVAPDGKIWVGSSSSPNLARLNPDGSLDTSITVSQVDRTVRDLEMLGNDLLVGGDFFPNINGTFYRGLVRISGATGQVEPSFGPVVGSTSVYTIAPLGNGKVLIGGSFATPVPRIARVVAQADVSLAITCQPSNQTLTNGQPLHLTVGWQGSSPATYQWTVGGAPLPGATNQTFRINSVNSTNAGPYTVIVTDSSGSVTSAPANVSVRGSGETYPDWAASNNIPQGQTGPNDDPDGDGVSNFVEFALGTNPTSAASKALPADRTITVNDIKYPGVALIRRKGVVGANVEVKAFGSIPFDSEIATIQEGPAEDLANGTERIVIRASQPMNAATIVFFLTRIRQE